MSYFDSFIAEITKIEDLKIKRKITRQEYRNLIEEKLEERISYGFEEIKIENRTYSIIKSTTGKSKYILSIFRKS